MLPVEDKMFYGLAFLGLHRAYIGLNKQSLPL